MTVDTATYAAHSLRDAAARTADLADIFRRQAEGHPAKAALLLIAGHLSTALDGLRTYTPPVIDGTTVTNTTPAGTGFALMHCMAEVEDNPEIQLPGEFFYIVTAPITRRRLHKLLPALHPAGAEHARKEDEIRTAIRLIEHDLDDLDPVTRYGALNVLIGLCRAYVELTAAVKADTSR
ncbi:hypothetical protein B0E38_01797 [Streptomyces sp. 111WW2]|uniref:hypothetical protein n=1 Tax=Streptomyces sp. 111WW2 TaxID=1945515 RepID=UPI000D0C8841|nr:hypothetical protein [Streptomyces sp. 111WW2]PSK57952.1 hypothetical protein B0E38_01797 [Streptomyces sp. 111WW2]